MESIYIGLDIYIELILKREIVASYKISHLLNLGINKYSDEIDGDSQKKERMVSGTGKWVKMVCTNNLNSY